MRNSDAHLIRASRAAAALLREVYQRHADTIYGYHLRRTRDPDAAHDLAAETFARAWLGRSRFRDTAGGSAAPELFGIARNVLLESVRRPARAGGLPAPRDLRAPRSRAGRGRADRVMAGRAGRGAGEPAGGTARGDRAPRPPRLDYDDVARALTTTPSAARVRVSRGLATLRDYLTRMEA
jgi:RNA polymerase sigma-70 factor (ECF subfamily)